MDDQLFNIMRLALELAVTAIGAMMMTTLKDLGNSVRELNVKIAVICERVDSHERRIDKLEKT